MYSSWSNSRTSQARNDTTRRISWTQQNYQRLTQKGCPQFPRSHPGTTMQLSWWLQRINNAIRIRTAAPKSIHPAWKIWTCHPIQLTSLQQWRYSIKNKEHDNNYSPQSPEPSEPSPISMPPINVSIRTAGRLWHDDRWQHVLLWWWTSENIIFAFNSCPTATTSKAEKEIDPGNVLSRKRGSDAARLRSLRTDYPLGKGHSMSINKELELWKH